jgi:hypothetical protein
MTRIYIDEARVTLAVASESPSFYSVAVDLDDDVAAAIMAEQRRKFELSTYLVNAKTAVSHRRDSSASDVPLPDFIKEALPSEQPTKPKATRSKKARV